MQTEAYILQNGDTPPDYLQQIERETYLTQINPRMCSGAVQGRILRMLVAMIQPQKILEIGTFTGYSALCMAEALPVGATIDTIEIDDELEDMIQQNFASTPYAPQIKLHIGDACELIPTFESAYDLIFIDADKKKYSQYYDLVLPKVKKGGFIFADNTLWNNKVLDEKIDPRDKQTIEIMRFNQKVKEDESVESIILPIRDGLSIIRKK